MIQEICSNILNEKLQAAAEIDFPLNANKIASMEYFSSSIRQFFSAEISYYCNNLLKKITTHTNISLQLLDNEDKENLINILYDWVEFDEDQTKLILENAIKTELIFLLSPAKCLSLFLFKKNENLLGEKNIKEIIKELVFFTAHSSIITALENELLELANTKESLSESEFSRVVNDIVFNKIQGMEISELISPLKSIQDILGDENIPLPLLEIFFNEIDLAGILTKIKEFADENEKYSLTFDEILSTIDNSLINNDAEIYPNEVELPANMEEFVAEVENAVDTIITDIYGEETFTVNEFLETEFDENILSTEIESNELPIVENSMVTESIEFTDIAESEASDIIDETKNETILNIIKMKRAEGLDSVQIETIYLELENKFLVDFRNKLLM